MGNVENLLVPCACGCGQLRLEHDKQGRERKYISGHNSMTGKTLDEIYGKSKATEIRTKRQIKIPYDKIIELYVNQGKSLSKTATILGCSNNVVRGKLVKLNIHVKSKSEIRKDCYVKDIPRTKLLKLYKNQKKTSKEIAKIIGCSQSTILSRLKDYDIPRRSSSESRCSHYTFLEKEFEKLEKTHTIIKKMEPTGCRVVPNLDMSEDLAYIIGVIYGDGWIYYDKHGNYRVALEVTKKEFALSFKNALCKIGLNPSNIYERKRKDRQSIMYLVFALSKKFYEYFSNLDIRDVANTINEKRIWILAFLRGLYESDGSIRRRQRHGLEIKLTNTDMKIIWIFRKLLNNIGISSSYIWKYNNPEHSDGNPNHKPAVDLYITGSSPSKRKFIEEMNPVIKRVPC